ncbi:MAG: iron-containing alcohol dehydrogenase [Actinobacteria bacterium]|nr:iron-containing alcohol dehydrogenase [Actinomycetota bacterium]MBU1942655.1 iron-containing alcohol dehydrogenase [Actinomycetota bacterium]MBU2685977.1 iron-containing alcohol dehydrogenase [Actinomycetota bacterium]
MAFVEWFEFQIPGKVICAENAVSQIGGELDKTGGTKAFLVTDEGVEKAGLTEKVIDGLGSGEAELVGTFKDVPPNSEIQVVQSCYDAAKAAGADCLISVGGGSVIDTTKGCALLMVEGGDLIDHQSAVYMPTGPVPPHIAVPTTAGTGSESTFAAVIKDAEQQVKLIFQGPELAPTIALLDPMMTLTLPSGLTAATGMDALTHCIEALHSEMHEPICDGLALHGIRLISEYLPRAVRDGSDVEARTYMMIAANMGGVAFANAFVGIVHAMAHSVGGRFGVPHGVANAILLPVGMEFNLRYVDEEVPSRYRMVADALGLDVDEVEDLDAAMKAIEFVRDLTVELNIPQRLSEVEVPEDGLEAVTEDAMVDGSMFNNPGEPEYEEVLELFKSAY